MMEKLDELFSDAYISAYHRARIYMGLGDVDKVIEMVSRAFEERPALMPSLRVDPILLPLHDDPRIQELQRRFHDTAGPSYISG